MTPDDAPPASPAPLASQAAPVSSAPPGLPPLSSGPAPSAADEALLAAVVSRGEGVAQNSNHGVLLITAVLFIAAGGLQGGWESVLFTLIAVALHELGHVLAMRFFGYKNVRMLFIPFFGGLATGQPRELDAGKNALVALAGPLFGLLTAGAAAALAYALGSSPWLVKFAWVSVILNAFNLIPFIPLDGGQVANETLFSRYPALELTFRLIAICGLGALAWIEEMWMLSVVVVLMVIGTPTSFRRSRLVRDARRDPTWLTRPLDHAAVAQLRDLVTQQFKNVAPEKYARALPDHIHGLWLSIRKQFPGPGKTVLLLAAYAFTSLIVAPAIAFFLVRFLERPEF